MWIRGLRNIKFIYLYRYKVYNNFNYKEFIQVLEEIELVYVEYLNNNIKQYLNVKMSGVSSKFQGQIKMCLELKES